MSYITEGDLENHILQDIDASFSTWIASVITMVESYIEQYTGVDFENASATTRYFDTDGSGNVILGDYQTGSLTSVQILNSDGNVESTLSVNTDFVEYPYSGGSPHSIQILSGGQYSSFPYRSRGVKVTGTFGYATPPGAVKIAAIKLAAKMINEGLRGGQVSSESLGSYQVSYKELDEAVDSLGIKEILNQYRVMSL